MMYSCLKVMTFFLIVTQGSLDAEQYFVRQSTDISDFEKQVLKNRFPIIKEAVEKCTGQSLNDVLIPSIAIVASGGGCRATIASLAFIDALNDLGVLDTCSHLSTLSGSTWMLGSLLAHQYSLKDLKNYLQERLAAENKGTDVKSIFEHLKNKYYCNQTITLTDIFGCCLAYIFLKGIYKSDPLDRRLSSAQEFVRSGCCPFPLFTALLDNNAPREFVEFSPWEIGSADYLESWVNTMDFGKQFFSGVSNDVAPEQSLGFLLGIFGSGYAFDFSDMMGWLLKALKNLWNNFSASINLEHYSKSKNFVDELCNLESQLNGVNAQNLFQRAALVNNFTKGLENSPIKDVDQLILVDAGIECNLPFAPLLIPARNIGLYIVCDVSGWGRSDVIKNLEDYAKGKGYKLPGFDYRRIDNNEVCCFYDDADPSVPVIVYIPHVADVATLKFSYSEKEFNDLYDSMVRRVMDAKYVIQEGIRIAVQNTIKRVRDSSSVGMTDPANNSSGYGCIIS